MAHQFYVEPVLDNGGAYADGNVLFNPIEVPNVFPSNRDCALLQSVFVIDQDDQGVAFDLVFFNQSVTLGTVRSTITLSDANARYFQGRVQIVAGDYYDFGGVRLADPADMQKARLMRGGDGARSLWVGAISRGAGTYSVGGKDLAGLKLRLGFVD